MTDAIQGDVERASDETRRGKAAANGQGSDTWRHPRYGGGDHGLALDEEDERPLDAAWAAVAARRRQEGEPARTGQDTPDAVA
jgi:hypothetical protein